MHCRSLVRERRYSWLRGEESTARAAAGAESSSASATASNSDASERPDVRKALLALHAVYEVPGFIWTCLAAHLMRNTIMERVSNGADIRPGSVMWQPFFASMICFTL